MIYPTVITENLILFEVSQNRPSLLISCVNQSQQDADALFPKISLTPHLM